MSAFHINENMLFPRVRWKCQTMPLEEVLAHSTLHCFELSIGSLAKLNVPQRYQVPIPTRSMHCAQTRKGLCGCDAVRDVQPQRDSTQPLCPCESKDEGAATDMQRKPSGQTWLEAVTSRGMPAATRTWKRQADFLLESLKETGPCWYPNRGPGG